MEKRSFKLIDKEVLNEAGNLWRLRFEAPGIDALPGQFVNIAVPGKYLRRPISVAEYDGTIMTLIVAEAGEGTRILVKTRPGEELEMLTGLGNTFNIKPESDSKEVLLLGGGVGYAPLIGLMKRLIRESEVKPLAVFGFNTGADVPAKHIEEMEATGLEVKICTMNGDKGFMGNPVEVAVRYIEENGLHPGYFYACGPMGMMKAAIKSFSFDGELSLESRMGCGYGACMGCTIQTAQGPKRICKEGPVFKKVLIS